MPSPEIRDKKELSDLRQKRRECNHLSNDIHDLATKHAKKHLEKIHKNHKWITPSHTNANGADIEGRLNGKLTVQAEVKTMEPKKGIYKSNQKEKIREDLYKLQESSATSKYFFVLDDDSKTAIMDMHKEKLEGLGITVLTINECLKYN